MPRRRKPEDFDFAIHVDQSCLSGTNEQDENSMSARTSLTSEHDMSRSTEAMEELESQIREQLEHVPETNALERNPEQNPSATPSRRVSEQGEPEQVDAPEESEAGFEPEQREFEEPIDPEDGSVISHDRSCLADEHSLLSTENPADAEENSILSDEHSHMVDEHSMLSHDESALGDVVESIEGHSINETRDDATIDESILSADDQQFQGEPHTPEPRSRRESELSATSVHSPRRGSGRTEALIQEAARKVVAQIEQGQGRDSLQSVDATEDTSLVSQSEGVQSHRSSDVHSHASRRSTAQDEQTVSADEAASGSSHHENEDDVFSDHSPRSSVGCPSDIDVLKMHENVTRRSRTRSPRVSGVSGVSGFSQYEEDEDDFIPTVRGTPRPAFRSPSSVKAMQMSSPPASVFGSPRSSRRTPLPTVSRLGSPGISAQYSPKKTPPRFKRQTPPLVLLHVTLLPLRWGWGDILDNARYDELSPEAKGLREAWRQLQDRMGDTTCERGILLPHPQNDYEVLEERLLEALELPLRRRARILECGHYLGPANEMTILDDYESEEEYDEDMNIIPIPDNGRLHWCSTCHSDIRYDSLGAGKVFRVKVYASNGLMKAGAWDTCWKEMERVDVELEPLVDSALQEELACLEMEQERALELHEEEQEEEEVEPEECGVSVQDFADQGEPLPEELTPPMPQVETTSPADLDAERRLRDEERLREIYGQTPPTHPEPDTPQPSFMAGQTPPSPSAEAFERRQERARQSLKSASLPELLLESARVMLQDSKNVLILVMGLLVFVLAFRGGNQPQHAHGYDAMMDTRRAVADPVPDVVIRDAPTERTVLETVAPQAVVNEEPCVKEQQIEVPPVVLEDTPDAIEPTAQHVEISTSTEIVRIVETVTETQTATVTPSQAAVEKAEDAPSSDIRESDELESIKASMAPEDSRGDAQENAEPETISPSTEEINEVSGEASESAEEMTLAEDKEL